MGTRQKAIKRLQATSLVIDNQDVFAEVARHAITKEDVVAVAYRKKQLQVFERLLSRYRASPLFEELRGMVLKTVGLVEPLRQAL